jgi:hypothetical protein
MFTQKANTVTCNKGNKIIASTVWKFPGWGYVGPIVMTTAIINQLHVSILLCGQEAYRRKEEYLKQHLASPAAEF